MRALIPQSILDATRPYRAPLHLAMGTARKRWRRLSRRSGFAETRLAAWLWSRRTLRAFRNNPPTTLNEKIRYRMAADRRPLLTRIADKAAARDYVAERVGHEILTTCYAVVERPEDIPWQDLPPRYVIKATHGSGATIVVDDRAELGSVNRSLPRKRPWGHTLRVHPDETRHPLLLELMRSWLASDYSRAYGITEWAYRDIPRRLIIEEFLDAGHGRSPEDFRFWCFEGEVTFLQVNLAHTDDPSQAVHYPDWSIVPAVVKQKQPNVPPPRPPMLETGLVTARRLSAELDFVRCDLYLLPDRVVFGELTNYPGGGGRFMQPEALFTGLSSRWDPTRVA